MKYAEYQKAFSAARLNKYLKACNGDFSSALTLYRHNVRLCQKFYGVLNIFEVVLRNAINNHYRIYYGDEDWIRNQLVTGGMLENHPQREAVDKIIAGYFRLLDTSFFQEAIRSWRTIPSPHLSSKGKRCWSKSNL